jgi:two-component system, NtrC family, response regulator AtoC
MAAERSGIYGPGSPIVVNRVLLVDDDATNCEFAAEWLIADGFDAEWHTSGEGALRALQENDFGVVVTDLRMPGMRGGELCRRISATRWDIPVIVASGFGGTEAMHEAMLAGAYDFIAKPFALETLSMALRRAFERRALQLEVRRLRRAARDDRSYGDLHGMSKAMRRLYDSLDAIARSDTAVLISGEVGTGREALARELHYRSSRGTGPFVAFNCAAMPEALLASNLFGHVRGTFVGTRGAHAGLLAAAERGTILLCEIAELPLSTQAGLLRACVEKRIVPVGGTVERPIDVRIMATSHRDLGALSGNGRFRADLFCRISANHLAVPPLRERGNDVLLLAEYFVQTVADRAHKEVTALSAAAAERLAAYHWPGNVRELRSCIERAVFLARSSTVEVSDLPERIRSHATPHLLAASADPANLLPLGEIERRYILHVLKATRGNEELAARCLGLSKKTLCDKLEAYADRESYVRGEIQVDDQVANE